MPSARLKLVKFRKPHTSTSCSPFCSNDARVSCDFVDKRALLRCRGEAFAVRSCSSCDNVTDSATPRPSFPILPPPQLHHFSKKSIWLLHYRRWLRNSKAVWMQRLHHQMSILHFFPSEPRRAPTRPTATAPRKFQAPLKAKLVNASLEMYGARAATFSSKRTAQAAPETT